MVDKFGSGVDSVVVTLKSDCGDAAESETKMPTVLVFHEVEDVDQWVTAPKRKALFNEHDVAFRAFADREGSNRVGLLLEVPDLEVVSKILADEDLAEAMKHDGVRPETLVVLQEAETH